MVDVGKLKINDVFYYKKFTYRIIDKNNIFVIAVRTDYDGITRYYLHSVKVEKLIKTNYNSNNPNHDITDRYVR